MDFNIDPYYDDLDPDKKFQRILFRPGYPVQTRELNQIQSLQQLQINRFGDHIFEEGAMVIPGSVAFDTKYTYVKVVSNSSLDMESYRNTHFFDKTDLTKTGGILQNSSGTEARVVWHEGPNPSNEITFYVKYIRSDTATGTETEFQPGQTLTLKGTAITCVVASNSPTGTGSAASIKKGVYYIRGCFVQVDTQNIILDASSASPSCRVGLEVVESIVTHEDPTDGQSLLDNAQGRPNETGPGAHRYRIVLNLKKLPLDSFGTQDSENFIELIRIENGEASKKVEVTDYSIIEQTLARRTTDESGDYTVKPFHVKVREFYNDGTNGGLYTPADFDFATTAEADAVSISRFGITDPGAHHTAGASFRPCASPEELLAAMQAKLVVEIDPGVAYVKGYEIRKIAKSYLDLDKSRAYDYLNNQSVRTQLGNYVLVSNLCSFPDIKSHGTVNLRDTPTSSRGTQAGSSIGTARVRAVEYDSGSGTTALYRLYLFDIRIDTGHNFWETKQISNATGFTADVSLTEQDLPGSVTLTSGSAAVSGQGTSFSTNPLTPLVSGDWFRVTADSGAVLTVKVSSVTNDRSLTLSANATATATNARFSFVYAQLRESIFNASIFQMPRKMIRSLKSIGDSDYDTIYNCYREFSAVAVGSNQVTIQTNNSSEEFVPFSRNDYIVTYTTSSGVTAGDIVDLTSSQVTLTQDSTYCTISGLTNGNSVKVVATVRKKATAASGPKTKTITSTTVNSGSGVVDLKTVSLGKADIIRVTKITMSASFTTAATVNDTDVTDRFDLDNGQRDNFYDLGKIVLKPGAVPPTGRLLIAFDYFTHGTNGNYFCVDSYTVINGFDYGDIPVYISTESGHRYELRDCLDFRPRVNDAGTGYDNTTGSLTEMPKGGIVSADFSYYLNRIDKLFIDLKGNFKLNRGIYGLNPPAPDEPLDGMVTHQFNIKAYTLNPTEVVIDFRENKRYTMRDIGRLEQRIANLEQYTSLSLLEKETSDLEIKDSDGLDRFKNGFVVDPFKGHGIGDVLNPDYRCAVDAKMGVVRPQFVMNNVKIEEVNTTTQQRSSDNYTRFNSLITAKVTGEKVLVQQPLASSYINVNPFNVISFLGNIVLDPPMDEWKDTETAPDLVVNQEGSFDSISQMANGMGTIWGEWQDQWYGQPVTTIGPTQSYLETSGQSLQHRLVDGALDRNGGWSRPGIDAWPVRWVNVTRSTTTVEVGRSRVGLQASVTPKTVTSDLGDKVISVSYIPYIRAREVGFVAKGLKPSTRVYPFFDNIAVSQFCKPASGNYGDALITDNTGKVSGTFSIPNSSAVRFRTGERIFRLSSDVDNKTPPTLACSANTVYRAQGLLETKQKTILSVRNADVAWDQVSEAGVDVRQTDSTTVEFGQWIDPVAQIIKIVSKGGGFISKVRFWFQAKDENIPITMQIREVVNGYPGKNVLPFSEVTLDSANINISEDSSAYTDFIPSEPVYVPDNGEYAVVLLTNSNKYYVWYAVKGQPLVGTEIPIEENPYAGSFFKSENSATWIADAVSDLKFQVYQYQFDTVNVADIDLQDEDLENMALVANPINTYNGSGLVRVNQPNHGMPVGSKVVITGVVGNNAPANDKLNNITISNINATHNILYVEEHSYVIDCSAGGTANITAVGGGAAVRATKNIAFDVLHPVIGNMVPDETTANFYLKTTSGRSTDGDQTPYTLDSSWSPIIPNDDVLFDTPRVVASPVNEQNVMVGGSTKSLFIKAQLSTSNANISPVIDTARMSAATIHNIINNPSPALYNISPIDHKSIVSANDKLVFDATASTISTSDSNVASALSVIAKGRYVKITGATKAQNNGAFRVVSATYNSGGGTFSMVVGENDGQTLSTNPIATTLNSDDITITHVGHKLAVGGSLTISGSLSVGGIPADHINGARVITSIPNADSYVVKANSRATSAASGGGSNILIRPGTGTLLNEGKTLGTNPLATTNTSTTVVVTHTAHGYKTGDVVVIRGATDTGGILAANLNGTRTLTYINANSYSFVAGAAASSDATGGGTAVIISSPFTLYYLDRFVDERAPQYGSNLANYIHRRVQLAQESNALHIQFAAYRNPQSILEVYYKIAKIDDPTVFDELDYVKAAFDTSVEASMAPSDFRDYRLTIDNLPDFNSFAVKICMKGTNSAVVPMERDYRGIALGT